MSRFGRQQRSMVDIVTDGRVRKALSQRLHRPFDREAIIPPLRWRVENKLKQFHRRWVTERNASIEEKRVFDIPLTSFREG